MKKLILFTLDQLVIKCENNNDYLQTRFDSGELNDEQIKICEHDISQNENYIETFKSLIEKWTK